MIGRNLGIRLAKTGLKTYGRFLRRTGLKKPGITDANRRWWPNITEEEINAVVAMLRAGDISVISEGGVIERMAEDFKGFFGTKFAVPQNSGTSTLHAAYFALGLGPGDEVIVPSATFHSSASTIMLTGARPVFCEVDPKTLTISPEDVENRITERTKAVCVVHWYGMPADMHRIGEVCKRHNIAMVEDASQAHGAAVGGRFVGTIGDIGCMSLQKQKGIAAGEGGVLFTNDPELYDRVLLLGHFGLVASKGVTGKYADITLTGPGVKYRIHPIAAALAVEQLKKFRPKLEAIRQYCALLEQALGDIEDVTVMKPYEGGARGAYQWGFAVSVPPLASASDFKRRRFLYNVLEAGVGIQRATPLLHLDRRFRDLIDFSNPPPYPERSCYGPGSLPITERIHPGIVVLEQHVENADAAAARTREVLKREIAKL